MMTFKPVNGQNGTVESSVLSFPRDKVHVLLHGRPLAQTPRGGCCHPGKSVLDVIIDLKKS